MRHEEEIKSLSLFAPDMEDTLHTVSAEMREALKPILQKYINEGLNHYELAVVIDQVNTKLRTEFTREQLSALGLLNQKEIRRQQWVLCTPSDVFRHGCKYGEDRRDNCPVVNGTIEQDDTCEECEFDTELTEKE